MAWNKNYSKVRNATWIWYLMAFACFVMAVKAYPVDGGSMIGFVWWVSAATGLTFSAGRAKRNRHVNLDVTMVHPENMSDAQMAESFAKFLEAERKKNSR